MQRDERCAGGGDAVFSAAAGRLVSLENTACAVYSSLRFLISYRLPNLYNSASHRSSVEISLPSAPCRYCNAGRVYDISTVSLGIHMGPNECVTDTHPE
jgi:hypothetical protein